MQVTCWRGRCIWGHTGSHHAGLAGQGVYVVGPGLGFLEFWVVECGVVLSTSSEDAELYVSHCIIYLVPDSFY